MTLAAKVTVGEVPQREPDNIDWSLLQEFEKEDNTSGGRELACSAGVCEVVDLTAA